MLSIQLPKATHNDLQMVTTNFPTHQIYHTKNSYLGLSQNDFVNIFILSFMLWFFVYVLFFHRTRLSAVDNDYDRRSYQRYIKRHHRSRPRRRNLRNPDEFINLLLNDSEKFQFISNQNEKRLLCVN